MKRIIFAIIIGLVIVTLGFAQSGEMNRGIFHQEGVASWYGNEFNGRLTANGEVFSCSELTAAHPFLPFGTMLKITNQHNDKSVIVRVNDRGPFVKARIIDLSRTAALQIDMLSTGTAPVKVESLAEVSLPANPGSSPVRTSAPAMQSVPAPSTAVQPRISSNHIFQFYPAIPQFQTGKNYRVQVGAYKEPVYAQEAFEKLTNAGLKPAYEKHGEFYRVVLPGLKQEELPAVSEHLGRAGFREGILREEM